MPNHFRCMATLLAAGALLAASACGGGGAKSTPTVPAPTATPDPSAPTVYPLTLTDMLGRSVTVNSKPLRIAALSPTTIEYVYALGRYSRTRPASLQYPPDALQARDFGTVEQPDLQVIAAEKPDIIIADSLLQPQLEAKLAALGVPVLFIGARNFDDMKTGIRLLGRALDEGSAARTTAGSLDGLAASIRQQLPGSKPKVLILSGPPTDFLAAKPESYAGSLLAQLHQTNIAAGQPDEAQMAGYARLTLSAIVAAQPDIILVIDDAPAGSTAVSDALAADPAWAQIPAVKNKRVSEIDAAIYRQPGPRANTGMAHLAELLFPDIFVRQQ